MYPATELAELANRKAVLRRRIALTRLECTTYAAEAARPLHWLDRFLVQWRKVSPLLKIALIPAGLLFRRRLLKGGRGGWLTRMLGVLPVVLRGVRAFKSHRQTVSAR